MAKRPSKLPVQPGDRVMIYTDGLTENFNDQNEMLGVEGLSEIVRATSTLPLPQMKEKMLDRIAQFRLVRPRMICRWCSWKFPDAGNARCMARLEFSQRIDATPALVSAFFVPQRMPYWYGYEMKAEFEILGRRIGFRSRAESAHHGPIGRAGSWLTAVVTRYDFGRALEWQFQDQYGVKGKQSWEIAAQRRNARLCTCATITKCRDASRASLTRCSRATPSLAATAAGSPA